MNKSPEHVSMTCRRAIEAAKAIIVADGFSGVISISTIDDESALGAGAGVVCGKHTDRALITGCKAQARNLLDIVGQTAEMIGDNPADLFYATINGAMNLNVVAEERGGG